MQAEQKNFRVPILARIHLEWRVYATGKRGDNFYKSGCLLALKNRQKKLLWIRARTGTVKFLLRAHSISRPKIRRTFWVWPLAFFLYTCAYPCFPMFTLAYAVFYVVNCHNTCESTYDFINKIIRTYVALFSVGKYHLSLPLYTQWCCFT